MTYEAIIFDMDGVVVDTKPTIEQFWQELAQQYGFKITPDVMEEYIHGCPTWLTFEKVFPMMSSTEINDFIDSIHEIEKTLSFNLITGVFEFLEGLSKAGVSVGLVTSGYQQKVEKVFKEKGLEAFFKEIVTAEMVKKGKPDPEPYLLSAKKLNVSPRQCVVFEDALSGIRSANAAGMLTVGINQSIMSAPLKEAGALRVIPNFSQVIVEEFGDNKHLNINGERIVTF